MWHVPSSSEPPSESDEYLPSASYLLYTCVWGGGGGGGVGGGAGGRELARVQVSVGARCVHMHESSSVRELFLLKKKKFCTRVVF